MATITQTFGAQVFGPCPSVTFPEKKLAGTNINILSLSCDAAADEGAQTSFRATAYGSGNITCLICWYADTASSGDVVWDAAIAALTPDTDTQDVETDAWSTAQTVTDSHIGTTGQRLHQASVTISNLDSIAAGDQCYLRIKRLGTNGSDTMSGDAQLTSVTLTYSDT